ncbi:MAG: chloride channel protein [Methylobacteriaceae bacterium]|jgi:H+/Cl- antiporter ClcA|nr:chloride channel protein [Methylobacteriaceae bacterium]
MSSTLHKMRPVRVIFFSGLLWKRRLVFLAGAVSVAFAAIVFALLADGAGVFYKSWASRFPWLTLLVTPAGFVACVYLTRRYFDGAQGSGVPQVIASRGFRHRALRLKLLNVRIVIGKILLTSLAIAVGASVGREGPTMQVGAGIMMMAAAYAGLGRGRGLVMAGSAAGIAAAFNTPLAGIIFALEEMVNSPSRRVNALIIAAVVVAGLVSFMVFGHYVNFGSGTSVLTSWADWAAVPLCAVIGGTAGGLFGLLMVALSSSSIVWINRLKARRLWFAAGCGLAVAVAALLTDQFAAGTGYAETKAMLEQGARLPVWYAPVKLLTTLLSGVCGMAGGMIAPSLATGAGFGSLAHAVLPDVPFDALCVLAMAGYFAGVIQMPLTAFVIVMEMTSDTRMMLPLLTTALIASGISRLINHEPLFHALARNWAPERIFKPKPPRRKDSSSPGSGTAAG